MQAYVEAHVEPLAKTRARRSSGDPLCGADVKRDARRQCCLLPRASHEVARSRRTLHRLEKLGHALWVAHSHQSGARHATYGFIERAGLECVAVATLAGAIFAASEQQDVWRLMSSRL